MSLRKQFGKPEGWLGYVVDYLMLKFNRRLNQWAIQLLDIDRSDSVLEIGFGPGFAVGEISERLKTGHLEGIDLSPLMVRRAQARNAAAIRQGKVNLRAGSVEKLPFDDGEFDKIISTNAVQFWNSLENGLREIKRVMRSGARLVIVLQDRRAKSIGDVRRQAREMVWALENAGFAGVEREVREVKPVPAYAVTAQNP